MDLPDILDVFLKLKAIWPQKATCNWKILRISRLEISLKANILYATMRLISCRNFQLQVAFCDQIAFTNLQKPFLRQLKKVSAQNMKHEAQNQVRIYSDKTSCFDLKFFKSVSRKYFVSFTNVSKVKAKKSWDFEKWSFVRQLSWQHKVRDANIMKTTE